MARSLARGVLIDRRRSPFLDVDVDLGLRILADIANRALSPAVNDPTTARQALHQMRVILHALAAVPPGEVAVVDWNGEARISLPLAEFRDYLSTALDGPSRYGAGDPETRRKGKGVYAWRAPSEGTQALNKEEDRRPYEKCL